MSAAELKAGNRARAREVFRWLQRVFPAPENATWKLEWVEDPQLFGQCVYETCTIEINPLQTQEVLHDTLLHEWGHVRDERPAEGWLESMEHDDHFQILAGRIYRRYMEEGGCEESKWIRSRA